MFKPIVGKTARIGARNVHFLQIGNGPRTVVLLHGFASLAQEIAAPFEAHADVKFLAFDRPGYGYSDPLPAGESTGPARQAKWLAEALDGFGEKNCVLVAHSMGSATALWLAARRPDLVSKLLLIAPFCRPTKKLGEHLLQAALRPGVGHLISERLVPSLASRLGPFFLRSALFPDPVPAHLAGFPFQHAGRPGALRLMAREYMSFQQEMPDFEGAPSLRSKLSVIFGSADRVARPDWHLEWLDRLKASLDVTTFDGTGHAPHHVRTAEVRGVLQGLL